MAIRLITGLTFLLGAIVCVIERRRLALVVLTVVATLNRESSAYYAVLWFWMYTFEEGRAHMIRQLGFAALIGMIAITESLVLRAAFRLPGASLSNHPMIGHNLSALGQAIRELPAPGWLGRWRSVALSLACGGGSTGAAVSMRYPQSSCVSVALTLDLNQP
jgi:hypothetical protein